MRFCRICIRQKTVLNMADYIARQQTMVATTDPTEEIVVSPDELPPGCVALSSPPQLAQAICSFYDPFVYSYCIFDFATIFHEVWSFPITGLSQQPALLLTSPYHLIRHPRSLRHVIGTAREAALSDVLQRLLSHHETLDISLTSYCRRVEEQSAELIPFLRGLCLCSSSESPLTQQVTFVLDELLQRGFVTDSLFIEGEQYERSLSLARLLMCCGCEFGSIPVMMAGVKLLRYSGIDVNYAVSKQIGYAVAKADKRAVDWAFKSSGTVRTKFLHQKGWL